MGLEGLEGISGLLRDALEEVRRDLGLALAALEGRVGALEKQRASERRCLSVREVCERYSLSGSSWDRWLADPRTGLEGVVWRVGRRVLVPVAEFEEWLRERGPGVAEQ